MMGGLLLDLRHAVRLYLKTPWQSALAVLMMAVAMALVSAMANLWSELHLAEASGVGKPDKLISIGRRSQEGLGTLGAGLIKDFSESSQTLVRASGESLFTHLQEIEIDGKPVEGHAAAVLPGYFDLLQPMMSRGRGLDQQDFADDGALVMVLSHDFWQDHFNGDPEIIGREVSVGEHRWRIVGVLDPAFSGIGPGEHLFWAPYTSYFRDINENLPAQLLDRIPIWLTFGRTADSTGAKGVEAELGAFLEDLPPVERAMAPSGDELMAIPGLVANPQLHRAAQRQVSMMLAATVLIALVAAVNVGIFLLARAPTRQRELALRQTVGATRRRLGAQLTIEAAMLVVLGTVIGVVLSIWLAIGLRELEFLEGADMTGRLLDWPALAFAALLAAFFTVLVALVPITLLRSRSPGQASRQVSARPGLFQHTAGFVQLSLAGLVAAAAVGFVAHLHILDNRDLGLTTDGIQVATTRFKEQVTGNMQQPGEEVVHAFRQETRERLGALPGVHQVTFGSPLPGQRMTAMVHYEIEGQQIRARVINAVPGFLDLLDIELVHGRDFESSGEPGVIVSRSFAEKAWGETDVVGRFLRPENAGSDDQRGRIIGVIQDVRYRHPDQPPEPLVVRNAAGFGSFWSAVLIRGQADADRIREEIDAALETHFDLMQVNEVKPLAGIVAEITASDRARGRVTVGFGIVIVAMTAFGFFATQRFLVDVGRRETAIRMALGAGPRAIRRHILLQGLRLGLPGLAVGSLLALIVTAWLNDGYITDAVSPIAIATTIATGLLALMLLASLQPARRAARLRPGELLKEE